MESTSLIHMFVTLVSILNPIGAIPIFLAITVNENDEQKKATIKKAIIAMIIILLISAFGGTYVLSFFAIDIDSFRIAGGILLLLMSVNMLQAKISNVKSSVAERDEALEKEDVAVVPLAIPLLAGPGAISTVILFSTATKHISEKLSLGLIVILVCLLIWPVLMLSKPLGERLGRSGLNIVTRIMGLILASIAVRFILEGVRHFFA